MTNSELAYTVPVEIRGVRIGYEVRQGDRRIGQYVWGINKQFCNCDHEGIGLALANSHRDRINNGEQS